jgi:hypothetical protein
VGLFEARVRRLVESARPAFQAHLDPGENFEDAAVALEGRSPVGRVLIVVAVLVVINVVLAFEGYELKSWVIGLSVGVTAAIGFMGQSRWLVLTDRRVLFSRHIRCTSVPGASSSLTRARPCG